MTKEQLTVVLEKHREWIIGEGGERANLSRANLSRANLYGANLSGANLHGAYLSGANLSRANLYGANLYGAYLSGSNLYGAYLFGANLSRANLSRANLYGANLSGAYLSGSNLSGSKLSGATGLRYQIPQEGTLTVYKKADGKIVRLEIPADAKRTASIVGRKCRCERARVLWIEGDLQTVTSARGFVYTVGEMAVPDKYDPDPRVECSNGIHFFQTREGAEEYQE